MKNPLFALLILALAIAGLPRAADGLSRGQRAGRYWLEAEYVRWRVDYERKRDSEYDEGRALDIAGVKPGMTVGDAEVRKDIPHEPTG